MNFDVVIIGAGVTGCSIARELSKYDVKTCVLEKGADVAEGTTKANSAIVHAGFDAKPKTLKGRLNARGNKMFDRLAEELDFPFKRIGALVLCFQEEHIEKLEELMEQGKENGVTGLRIINKGELKEMEPNISEEASAALFAPTSGIICPYEFTIALAENAFVNGVEFKFNAEVKDIERKGSLFEIITENERIEAKLVINAAGIFSDNINNMISMERISIIPRKGEYCLFDKAVGNTVSRTIFQLPNKMGKGVLVTPTVDGNLLIGPNAVDMEDREDVSTSAEGMGEVLDKAKITLEQIPMPYMITSFSGIRAHSSINDFIIGEAQDVENFINVAAIESPGLSSAPAIGEMVRDLVLSKLNPAIKKDFNPIRKGIPKFREMDNLQRQKLIEEEPAYGRMVCRCEMVTEGEIINAIKRPLGASTLDGVKRRTRAGMGRCQAGFCTPKLVGILAREKGIAEDQVTKFGGNSRVLIGKTKEM